MFYELYNNKPLQLSRYFIYLVILKKSLCSLVHADLLSGASNRNGSVDCLTSGR